VLAALAALADSPSRFTGIAHIRGHETDRLDALTRELTALGAEITELPDGLAIIPGALRGALFHTYDDHRMAHAAAVLGLAVPGVRLTDVSCVSKTRPDFAERGPRMVRGDGDGPRGAGGTTRTTGGSARPGLPGPAPAPAR